jgi:hypothetical protein
LPVSFSVVSQEKLEGSNALRVVVAVDPQQLRESFWKKHQQFDSLFFVSAKHTNLKVAFIAEWHFGSRLLLGSDPLPPRVSSYQPQQLLQIEFEYL